MSTLLEPKSLHKLLDRPFATPPGGPMNRSASVDKDQRCSSPGCPNFSTSRCSFCKLHCEKFHEGKHYDTWKNPLQELDKQVIEDQ